MFSGYMYMLYVYMHIKILYKVVHCIFVHVHVLQGTNLYFSGESGREHDSLSLSNWRHAALVNDCPDLRFKSHVQHPVSFI